MQEAAEATEGFSGRELAKMISSIQTAVYGSAQPVLTPELFRSVVDRKVGGSAVSGRTCLSLNTALVLLMVLSQKCRVSNCTVTAFSLRRC